MNPFSFLHRKFVKSAPAPAQISPFGLTQIELATLADLRSTDGYDTFIKVLDKLSILYGEAILLSNENVAVHFNRGYLSALRQVGSLVDEILNKQEDLARERTTKPDTSAIAAATFGTPFWNVQR